MRDIHPDIELMEQDEAVRRVVGALCPKVKSHFSLKKEQDFTSLLNALSNLTDQHLKSKSMRGVWPDGYNLDLFSFFMLQMVDAGVISCSLLDYIFANSSEGNFSRDTIRQAGKINWQLEKMGDYMESFAASDDDLTKLRNMEKVDAIAEKAPANAGDIIDDLFKEKAEQIKRKAEPKGKTEIQAVCVASYSVTKTFLINYEKNGIRKVSR